MVAKTTTTPEPGKDPAASEMGRLRWEAAVKADRQRAKEMLGEAATPSKVRSVAKRLRSEAMRELARKIKPKSDEAHERAVKAWATKRKNAEAKNRPKP